VSFAEPGSTKRSADLRSGGFVDRLPGVWRGDGEGHYPTIATFGYREELTFTRLGDKPVVSYVQRTWHHDDDRPLHAECGYLRSAGPRVELVIAQPTGFTEVHHGRDDGGAVVFGITAFARTATAVAVHTLRRRWALDGDQLTCDLWMTYDGVVDGHHLRSVLRPVPDRAR
jgi:hypothetical protein